MGITELSYRTVEALNDFYKDFPAEKGLLEAMLGSPIDVGVKIENYPIPLTKMQRLLKFAGFKVKQFYKVKVIRIEVWQ